MAKIRICKESNCLNATTTEGYCRLHYLRHWKEIKEETRRRSAKRLNKYIETVVKKHPDRYVDVIKKDLRSPSFDRYVGETFGYNDEETTELDDVAHEEEIIQLIKQLKIEKGF